MIGDAQPARRFGGHRQTLGLDAGDAVGPVPSPFAQGILAVVQRIVDRQRMVGARGVARTGVIADQADDALPARPCVDRWLPGRQEFVLRRLLVFEAATRPAERLARQRGVGQAHLEDAVIGRPVLESPRDIADQLEPDAAIAHPGPDHVEIFVSGRFLDRGIGGQHEVRRFAARVLLDQQRGAVDADAVGQHHWWRRRQRHDRNCRAGHGASSGSR